jgi:YYY domain-containing protein
VENEQLTASRPVPPPSPLAVWAPRFALILIILLGGYFRSLNVSDWDSGTGQHPDERFFSDVASTVRLPASLGELYDSARSPLNPRSYDKFPLYVYGPFPIMLTRAVAVALTPPQALPESTLSLNGPPGVGVDPAYPNEARTNYGPLVVNPERSFPRLPLLGPLFNAEGRNLTTYGEIQKVGRGLAVVLDLGSILLIYLIGRRLFGRRAGLLAAFLAACSAMSIQQSHFFVDPIYSTFFCLLSLYWAVRLAQGGGWISATLLGLSIGAAMANRITMATLGLMAIVATGIAAWRWAQAQCKSSSAILQYAFDRLLLRGLPLLVLAGAMTLLSFRTLAPDAFVGSRAGSPVTSEGLAFLQGAAFLDMRPEPRFLGNLGAVRGLVSGEVDFPPSQQWVGRPAYVFPWKNMVLWGMGPALGLAAWAGFAAFGLRGLRRLLWPNAGSPPLSPAWVIFAWAGFYFGWQGEQFAITLRYLLPIYGALIIFGAWGLAWLWDQGRPTIDRRLPEWHAWAAKLGRLLPGAGRALVALVLLCTLGWAYAFSRIYTQPHSRVQAARWLADHAPSGSYVLSEIWDDPLPLQATDASWGGTYEGISSAPYAEDEPRKYEGAYGSSGAFEEGLLEQLDRADYITLTSNRVYDSTSRLRMRYPALMRYYHHLFEGNLGFRLVAEITSYPTILGIAIPDQAAEEAFHVYDHPRVLIFEKQPGYSREQAEALITDDVLWSEVYKSPVSVADRNTTALRLTDTQWARSSAGGTWAERFSRESLVNALAPLLWIGVLELLGLAAFALLFHLLPRLPDRGYSLAKALGLLLVAYLAWLLGSLGAGAGVPGQGVASAGGLGPLPLPFTAGTLWLCAAPLLIGGGLVGWRTRAELLAFLRSRRSVLISAEAVFLGFTLIGLLLRWLNPDLWHPARGGEKPMDLAYFTAVLKSSAFPPYDPWHAGGYINYYYFGFVLVGAVTQLTTIMPSIAYNLAVATTMGLTALGAWGVVYNLLAPRRDDRPLTTDDGSADGRPPTPARRQALISAAIAPALLLLLGNLAQAFWYLSGYAARQVEQGRTEWAYWDATRIVAGTVNEFPFFTFLFGDLHAHMIVMPLSLALLGLATAYLRGQGPAAGGPGSQLRAWIPLSACLGLMGLLAGAIRATNTWDYPTFVGLAGLTLALAGWRASRGRRPLRWSLIWTFGPPLLVVLIGNLLFMPFTASFATESSGVDLWREGLAISTLDQVLQAQRTSTWDLIRLYGHWLFVAAAAGLLLLGRLAGPAVAAIGAVGLALVAVVGAALAWPGVALTLPMLAVALWALWRLRRAPTTLLLPALWLGAALGLTVLVELVAVKGDIGRMNTVFKFGLHTWTLFALGAAALLPRLWGATGDEGRRTADETTQRQGEEWSNTGVPPIARTGRPGMALLLGAQVVRGGLVLLALATLVYPLTASRARAADRWANEAPRTLDGNAYMASVTAERNGQPFSLNEDGAAIEWLERNVPGTPVLLEAHLPSYQWAGRVATNTGLPTLLGWEWHQIQQRGVVGASPAIAARQQAIAQIYNTADPDEALAQLRQFGVAYVYVGGVERATYDQSGLAKFDTMADAGALERVFQQGQTAIYRVVEPGEPRMLTSDLPVRAPTAEMIPPLLLDGPVDELTAVDEYAWNRLARESSWLSALLWLLAIYGVALLGLPVAHVVFGRWRDGGVSWAKPIGLLLLGYAVWLPTSLGLWQYNRWGLIGGLALVLLLDLALLWQLGRRPEATEGRGEDQPSALGLRRGAAELVASLRARRGAVLWGEGVFLAAFAALALIRAFNPDLWHPSWGGEKPMEFGFLNAILRSPVMPPYDPFFSGGVINYYYYGFFLVSLPIKLTGIAPAVGFNLAVATIYGLTIGGAFTVVAQLTGRARYGVLAAALLGVLGNLAGAISGRSADSFLGALRALGEGLNPLSPRGGDWYVGPSRVIPNTINEFPAFSFLFADLHPHLIALPIALLVVGLGLQIADRRLQARDSWVGASYNLHAAASSLLLALALGALAVTNSWDFPAYGLLIGLSLLGAAWRAQGRRARLARHVAALLRAGALGLAIAVGALALYAPFFDKYYAPVGGLGAVPWSGGTLVIHYLLIYGLFAAALLPTLAGAFWRVVGRQAGPARPGASLGISAAAQPWGGPLIIGALLLVVTLVALQVPALGLRLLLLALLLLSTFLLLRRGTSAAVWYGLLLTWVAWAISLGVELVYIRDHLDGGDWYRMNTVFKFGFQVWVLLALAAAASMPVLLRGLRRIGGATAQVAGLVLLGAVALLAAAYPIAAIPNRIANRFDVNTGLTLNGLAFLDQASFTYDCAAFGGCEPGLAEVTVDLSGDGPAIRWLNEQISGTPVVVQSDLWFYRAYGIRIAANTGLPTVISALHENEQRDPEATAKRDRETDAFFRTTDVETALRYLARYRVGYVYIGGVERAFYPEAGLAKFEQMSGTYLTPAYTTDKVQIYQVTGVPDSYARPAPFDFGANQPATPAAPPAATAPAGLEELEEANAANPLDGPTAFGLAEMYRAMGRLDDAATVLEPAARANPSDIGVIHLWGDILTQAGRYPEAEEAYMLAARGSPTADNWNKLGTALIDWGELDKAEIALSQAVAADPQAPDPHYQLGRLFAQRGDSARAAAELQAYLELAPAGPWAEAARSLLAGLGQ